MKTLTITRTDENDKNTLGFLTLKDSRNKIIYNCVTLELPYKDNKKQISCIPKGTYRSSVGVSNTKGQVVYVKGVTNRTGILIHIGNYSKDTLGCILVGKKITYSETLKEHYIEMSGITISELINVINKEELFVVIK
jgi:hypothetical protein